MADRVGQQPGAYHHMHISEDGNFAVASEGAASWVEPSEQTIPAPLRTPLIQFNNLPAQLTSLIGREREVAAASNLLRRENVRLLTLTGTGGIGKTRLGLAVATGVLDMFADGVCFVPLAPINDPALVVPTIARVLGLEQTHTGVWSARADVQYLKVFLQEKHFLLVLDNFEQVVRATPDLVEVLTACPHLKMLVTSRAALHVPGEQEFPVPSLALPSRTHPPDLEEIAQYASVALFVQRAGAVKHGFVLTRENAQAIAAISLHLDGLPLAIELAAARIKLLPPQALLQRLTHRLAVLTGGTQDAPARQQTLRNTLAWSYNLFGADEQRLFQRLSVFVGSFTLEAVESLCGALSDGVGQVLNGVASLIDKSLLQQTEREGDEPRLVMLETIREYGLECLFLAGELEQTRRAHAEYYLHLAEEAEAHLFGAEQDRWFDRLERELDNMRAILRWTTEQNEPGQGMEIILRLAGALQAFLAIHGHAREWRQWLDRALASSEGVTAPVRAKALNGAGWLAIMQGEYDQAEAWCQESLQLYREFRDPQGTALALYRLGMAASTCCNYGEAVSLLEESVTLYRKIGDKGHLAFSLMAFGLTTLGLENQGKYTRVRSLLEESLALFKETNFKEGIAWSLYCFGVLNFQQGAALTSRSLLEESLAIFRALGYRPYIAHPLYFLGKVAALQEDLPTAYVFFKESLVISKELGDQRSIAACLEGWGGVVARRGAPLWAAQLWGAAERLRGAYGPFDLFTMPGERSNYERMVGTVRSQLGEKAFATAWAEGRVMTPEQVLAKQGLETVSELAISVPQLPRVAVPTSDYPNGLTAREAGVLRLVAGGLTNSEIAEELGLSEKTIAHHLTRTFTKTSSENRAAAAAFAIRHGLA